MKKKPAEHRKLLTTWRTEKVLKKELVGERSCGDSVMESAYESKRKSKALGL